MKQLHDHYKKKPLHILVHMHLIVHVSIHTLIYFTHIHINHIITHNLMPPRIFLRVTTPLHQFLLILTLPLPYLLLFLNPTLPNFPIYLLFLSHIFIHTPCLLSHISFPTPPHLFLYFLISNPFYSHTL